MQRLRKLDLFNIFISVVLQKKPTKKVRGFRGSAELASYQPKVFTEQLDFSGQIFMK
jgi:hypothetical protein